MRSGRSPGLRVVAYRLSSRHLDASDVDGEQLTAYSCGSAPDYPGVWSWKAA